MKRFLILCTFFTLGACLDSSNTIHNNSCGGAVIAGAARHDATAIFKNTATTIATWENCMVDTSSFSDNNGYSWNATWMGSEQEDLSSSPRQFARLALFDQESCLVVFSRTFALDLEPVKSSSSESFIVSM